MAILMTVVRWQNICVYNYYFLKYLGVIVYNIVIMVKSFSSKTITIITYEVNNFNNYIGTYEYTITQKQ